MIGLMVLNSLLIWRAALDVFTLPRATMIAFAAIALISLTLAQVGVTGTLRLPSSRIGIASALFIAGCVVALFAGDDLARSFIGPYTRYTGFAMYFSYAVIGIVAMQAFDYSSARQLALSVLIAGTVVTGYGLLQAIGGDPLEWIPAEGAERVGRVSNRFSTFGNVNFSAAFVGMTTPFALWLMLQPTYSRYVRLVAGGVAGGMAVYVVATGSFQGPVAGIAGSAVVIGVWLTQNRSRLSEAWPRLSRPSTLAVTGVVTGLAVVAIVGPVAADEIGQGKERLQFWQTAIAIWDDAPIIGQGFGSFARQFLAERPVDHALERQSFTADSPHNVAIEFLTSGGVALAVAYVVLVVAVADALFRGLRSAQGERQLLLAAFGGGWVAYQVQSLVSIDVPPLAVTHWVLMGAIGALANENSRRVIRIIRAVRRRPYRVSAFRYLAYGALAGAVLTGSWVATRPLRADLAARDAKVARAQSDLARAVSHADRATDLAPWEGTYFAIAAGALDQSGRLEEAFEVGARAAREEPGNPVYAMAAGGLAQRMHRPSLAVEWYRDAVRRDPKNPRILLAVGRHLTGLGLADDALQYLERALDIDAGNAEAWALLGDAHAALRAHAAAEAAYEEALELDEDNARAARGLERSPS